MVSSNGLSPTVAMISSPTLLADKEYLFWVKARNAVGYSPFSDSITIHSASLPGAPDTPFRVSSTTTNSIVVGWHANTLSNFGGSSLTNYQVWWDQGSTVSAWAKYNTVSASTYTQIFSPVTTSEVYTFYIVAVNVIGAGPHSSTV